MDHQLPASSMNFEELLKDLPKRTFCCLVVDLVNSAFFKVENDNAAWQANYRLGFSIIAAAAEMHNGRIVKFLGDGFLVVFDMVSQGDPEEDCVRAAVSIQTDLAKARQEKLNSKFQVRISVADVRAHPIKQTHKLDNGATVDLPVDFLGADVDLVFRLNDAIAANGIIANRRLIDNVRWGRMTDELSDHAVDGDVKRFLGRITLKGFGPVEAHEIAWGGKFHGLKGAASTDGINKPSDESKSGENKVDFASTAPRLSSSTPYVPGRLGASMRQTHIGHVYSVTTSGQNFWIEEHSADKIQHIGVSPNVIRREVPELGEVVLFVRRPGSPHPKAVQILRSGTEFAGIIRDVNAGTGTVKIDEYAAKDHDPISYAGDQTFRPGDKVAFTLVIEGSPDGEGAFVATANNLKKAD